MTVKYHAILTNQGATRMEHAVTPGNKLNLTQMAVGDANGTLPTPDPAQTSLINQKRIAPLNMLSIDPNNPGQLIAEQIIPENEGGFWIREIGLFDDEGVLIAVANCPETYKPKLQEGSGRTQTIRMILTVSNTDAVTLIVDPAIVLATRQYVDNQVIEIKELLSEHEAKPDPHPQYVSKTSEEMKLLASVTEIGKKLLSAGAVEDIWSLLGHDSTFDGTPDNWCIRFKNGFMVQGGTLPETGPARVITYRVPFTTAVLWHDALGYQDYSGGGGLAYYKMHTMKDIGLTSAKIGMLGYFRADTTQFIPSPSSMTGGKYIFMGY